MGSAGGPPGGMLSPGGAGQPGAGMAAGPAGPTDPTRSIVVVIPYTKPPVEKAFYPKLPLHPQTNPKWPLSLPTLFGFTHLFTDGGTVQWYFGDLDKLARQPTRQTQIATRYTAWQKSRAEEPLLDLVSDALEYGMVAEAVKYADELVALTKEAKKSPADRVRKFAQAYGAVQAKLMPRRRSRTTPSGGAT